MKALLMSADGEVDVVEVEKPVTAAGEVLIKIKAAALNHRELWIAKGMYPGMTLPCILGADGSGVIESVGEGVDESKVGEEVIIYPGYDWGDDEDIPLKQFRVLGMPEPGCIAEYISVPVENIAAKPAYLSWEEASSVPVAGVTAWRSLTRHGNIKEGSKVLITGIGGGVAQAGLSIAKSFGAKVYVTSSKTEKIEDAIKKGAEGGVNYKYEDWCTQLKELSGGIDIVLDSSPGSNLDDYLKFLNVGARVVAYGSTGSRKTTLNISKYFLRHIKFIGTAMGSPAEFEALLKHMEAHDIKPVIEKTFSLAESLLAMETLAAGNQIGKVVITMDS